MNIDSKHPIRLDKRPSPPSHQLLVLQHDFPGNEKDQLSEDEQERIRDWLARRFKRQQETQDVEVSIPTALCSADTNPAWFARHQQNKANSILYQLPEEILVKIRDFADRDTQNLMRRACGLLMRIVADRDLCPATRGPIAVSKWDSMSRTGPGQVGLHLPHWMSSAFSPLAKDNARNHVSHLAGRGLCPVWPMPSHVDDHYLTHPFEMLSLVERDSARRCHDCIAVRESPQFHIRRAQFATGQLCVDCGVRHGSHLFTNEMTKSSKRGGPRPLCVYRAPSVGINLCSHKKITFQGQAKAGATGPTTTRCNDASCNAKAWTQPMYRTELTSSTLAFELDVNVPVTREHIRQFLASTKKDPERLGQFCPHVKPWDGRLLLPFSADQCVCFPDAPSARHGAHHALDCMCCRCQTKRAATDRDWELTADGKTDAEIEQDSKDREHGFMADLHMHRYKCNVCEATYDWQRKPQSQAVHLRIKRFVGHRRSYQKIGHDTLWLRMIDPRTWLTSKPEAKHILWCDAEGCETTRLWRQEFPDVLDSVIT